MATYVVHLAKPLGLGVVSRNDLAFVATIRPDGAAAAWNEGELARQGRTICVGHQIVEVLDAEGQAINNDEAITFADLMALLRISPEGELISLRLAPTEKIVPTPGASGGWEAAESPPASSASWAGGWSFFKSQPQSPQAPPRPLSGPLARFPRLRSTYRSVEWRFHLGVCDPFCSPEEFLEIVARHRHHYEQLLEKHHVFKEDRWHDAYASSLEAQAAAEDAEDAGDGGESPARPGPQQEEAAAGMPAEDEADEATRDRRRRWEAYRSGHRDMLDMLVKDIRRTFAEFPFFQDERNQRLLERILFVWALEQGRQPEMDGRSDFAYRQGMHELLAVVIMVLYKDVHRLRAQANTSCEELRGSEATTEAADEQALVLAGDRAARRALRQLEEDPGAGAAAPASPIPASPASSEEAGDEHKGPPAAEAEADGPVDGPDEITEEDERYLLYWRSLHAYYTTHAPHKLNGIDDILRVYRGREDILWSDLGRKYGVPPQTIVVAKQSGNVAGSPRGTAAGEDTQRRQASATLQALRARQELVDSVVDPAYLEHDAYTLFQYLMHSCLAYYTGAASIPDLPDAKQPPLYRKVQTIHFELLKRYDRELWEHLQSAGVLPQLFLIRWLRVLFTREFTLQQAFLIWDHLLPSKGLDMADYVCVAMLIYVRQVILAEDPSRCLMSVFHYPTLSDHEVREMLALALKLHSGEYQVPLGTRAKFLLRQAKQSMSNTWASFSESVRRRAARPAPPAQASRRPVQPRPQPPKALPEEPAQSLSDFIDGGDDVAEAAEGGADDEARFAREDEGAGASLVIGGGHTSDGNEEDFPERNFSSFLPEAPSEHLTDEQRLAAQAVLFGGAEDADDAGDDVGFFGGVGDAEEQLRQALDSDDDL